MFLPRTLLTKKSGDTSEASKRKVDPISASAVKKPKKTGFSAAEPPPSSPSATPSDSSPANGKSAASPIVSPPPRTATTIAGALAAAGAGMSALDAMNLRMELEQAKSMAKAKLMASQMSAQASMRIQQLNFMGLGSRTPLIPLPVPPMPVPRPPPQAPASEVEFTVERRPMMNPSPAAEGAPLSILVPPPAAPTVIAPLSPDSKAKLPLHPYFPQFTGCRSVQRYSKIRAVAQGTYGTVYKAKDNYSNEIVALKRFKKAESGEHGFPKHFLCEINILSSVKHRNLIGLREVVLGRGELDKADVFLVLDWAEHDLQSIMRKMSRPFTLAECKCLMRQLLRAVHALDSASVMHRDLKPANLLYDMNEARLMVCDLGEARRYSDGDEKEAHTPGVMALRYRAPEILMGCTSYDSKVDMWAVGCIFGKMLSQADLIQGTSELDMLAKMFALLGTPTDETWPSFKDTPLYSKHPPTEILPSKLRERFLPEEARGSNLNRMGSSSSSRGFRTGSATPNTARLTPSSHITPSGRNDVTPSSRSDITPSGRVDVTPSGRVDVTPSGRVDVTPSGRVDVTPSGRNSNTTPSAGGTPDLMRTNSTPTHAMCPPAPRVVVVSQQTTVDVSLTLDVTPSEATSSPNISSPAPSSSPPPDPSSSSPAEDVEEGELNDGATKSNDAQASGSTEIVEQDLLESFLADIEGMAKPEEEKQEQEENANRAMEEDMDCEEPGQPVPETGENDDTGVGSPCYLSDLGFDLLTKFLQYDPAKRISAKEALRHPFFREAPLPLLRKQMPKFFEVKE